MTDDIVPQLQGHSISAVPSGLILEWCEPCNQTQPHELGLKVGDTGPFTTSDKNVIVPITASLVCLECLTTRSSR